MNRTPVIAIFDVGKTNKKLFLFDEEYKDVYEETAQLQEAVDEDGDACEDLGLLTQWIRNRFENVLQLPQFEVKAVNFSAYGASFVHLMEEGNAVLPLYNYLKPYPQELQNSFYNAYGGEAKLAKETASPVSGSLNSGLQLYRIKKQQEQIFKSIRKSLHLPQYLSFLITNKEFSDITSIGCHTALWDFEKVGYHRWVCDEGIDQKLAPIKNGNETIAISYNGQTIIAGIGLHDSSAALIPYLINFIEPFVLISTGTWCISLNPYNNTPLSEDELQNDCLCYLQYQGLPVKANRLFAGYQHEQETQKLSKLFQKPMLYYKQVRYDIAIIKKLNGKIAAAKKSGASLRAEDFTSYEEAYHLLMLQIIEKQVASTQMIMNGASIKHVFVDGGFSKNAIYMNLLAAAFPAVEVYAASMAQATAIGAALAIHSKWNSKPIPDDFIKLKLYPVPQK